MKEQAYRRLLINGVTTVIGNIYKKQMLEILVISILNKVLGDLPI